MQLEQSQLHFWAKATILKAGKKIGEQSLKWDKHGYILPDKQREQFIGEANFILPEPEDKTPLTLIVEGSDIANFDEGVATPIGITATTAKAEHQLPVVEEK